MEIDTEIFSAGTDGKYVRSVSVASKHFLVQGKMYISNHMPMIVGSIPSTIFA